jgi:hypothetical protein
VLVIFPEAEIYYLNDLVQPFPSGAVAFGMQGVVEARRTTGRTGPPTWGHVSERKELHVKTGPKDMAKTLLPAETVMGLFGTSIGPTPA